MTSSSSSITTISLPTSRWLTPTSDRSKSSAYARRLLLAFADPTDNASKVEDLRRRIATTGKASDAEVAAARQHINEQIADPLDFDDKIALARLDVRIESLQEERRRYEAVLFKLLAAAEVGNKVLTTELLRELDDRRDDFDRKIEAARSEMRRLAGAAIVGTRAYQRHVVQLGLVLLAIAALLGITVAAAVSSWTWEETASARKGGDGIGLEIIAKLATVLEVEPAELLRIPGRRNT